MNKPRRSCLSLEVEVGPGAQIDHAAEDLIMLANLLGICVDAKFNDVLMMAHPGGDPARLAANWRVEFESQRQHKIAVSYER